ncbi:4Fe-4S binding protein [Pseudodesulfovibrio cashew]|uniref:4Fe-4S binding protein n=1 Tax=Pseudodesulfovibrio cashew TaxID=2678688 RepID=A0A6I6JB65_9BACT|nr:4Fe-4S binding protein [Pseudodesulfovibrio cashew]QGY40016.1 4Fe-4S binding protein [Pseudodesulfovibrio cashew]
MKFPLSPVRFRLALQAAFTLFNLYVGFRFAAFLAWAGGHSPDYVPKPGAVEGFLPISALLGLRHLVNSGQWDFIHPAGLTIFLAVLGMAVLFRKGFCGYVCPVGFLSNLLDHAGRRVGLSRVPPKVVDYPLTALKYLGMGFFLFSVFFAMDTRSLEAFLTGPYNSVADARMLGFFMSPSGLSLMVLGGFGLFSLVVRGAWCRYLCPYGALLGLLSWFGPVAVSRDRDKCVSCGKCAKGCPAGIRVDLKQTVRTPECIGCMECVGACPVDGCLEARAAGRRIPWPVVGLGAVCVLLLFWVWAKTTGHWDSTMPQAMLARLYAPFAAGN